MSILYDTSKKRTKYRIGRINPLDAAQERPAPVPSKQPVNPLDASQTRDPARLKFGAANPRKEQK